jgi:hypothetical protein
VEEHHEERFKNILEQIESVNVWKKDNDVEWVCRNVDISIRDGTSKGSNSCDHRPKNIFKNVKNINILYFLVFNFYLVTNFS